MTRKFLNSEKDRLRVGMRLPALRLATVSGAQIDVRLGGRDASVIVLVDDDAMERATAFLERLARAAPEFRVWGGRILGVVRPADRAPGESADPSIVRAWAGLEQRLGFPLLLDREGRTRDWTPAAAAVLVADRFGDVYHVAEGAELWDLTTPSELEDWLRFLATQCPECGVPDSPGHGEWGEA